jgi:hypothetical protein
MSEFNRLGAQGLVESRCIWAEHLQHSVNVLYGDHGILHVGAKDSLWRSISGVWRTTPACIRSRRDARYSSKSALTHPA